MNAFNYFPKFSGGQVCGQKSLRSTFFHSTRTSTMEVSIINIPFCGAFWVWEGGVVCLFLFILGFPNDTITFMDPDIVKGFSYVTSIQRVVCLSPQRMHRYSQGEFYFSGIHASGFTAFPCMLPLRIFHCVLIPSSVNRYREGSLW